MNTKTIKAYRIESGHILDLMKKAGCQDNDAAERLLDEYSALISAGKAILEEAYGGVLKFPNPSTPKHNELMRAVARSEGQPT